MALRIYVMNRTWIKHIAINLKDKPLNMLTGEKTKNMKKKYI